MKRIITFDEIFRSCAVGRFKRDMTEDEIKLNAFSRASHKIINIYLKYNIYFRYADETVQKGFSKEELLRLYKKRLSKKKTTARYYYNLLLNNSPAKKCQLCYIGKAESLDHFLPKELFPSLSISPNNLIPVCGVCNQIKSSYIALTAEEQLLHPRYGEFYSDFLLMANFDTNTNRVIFNVSDRVFNKNSVELKRISYYVEKFGIITAFETKAMDMLRDFVKLAILNNIEVEDVINEKLALLNERYKELNVSKYTIYQWQWLTCCALLNSPYFLINAKLIFGAQRDIYMPDYGFE
ncbi:HNH endonuclease [Enterobacter roggenkampii]|uniref:HNH endonuclease n=1 Tax=Enterobacter roggenkampii TaxID=1812935 RepID=UPI0018673D74|nr:HNH endonuclease [Enterobacter roggenkampii]